ncbi:MAG: hypothetical protein QXK11_11500 [Pyrobaculum sp.]|uniref:hypothetical protein n=1 Tax=Pyrobaculum sp. TaxID=2004705 RepID=UPI003179CDD9
MYNERGGRKKGGKWTTIIISVDVKMELDALRAELGARSFNEVIKRLIDERKEIASRRIKSIVCNDMSEVSASLVGWTRLLMSRGLKPSEVIAALEYLAGTQDELRVDRSKCSGH